MDEHADRVCVKKQDQIENSHLTPPIKPLLLLRAQSSGRGDVNRKKNITSYIMLFVSEQTTHSNNVGGIQASTRDEKNVAE